MKKLFSILMILIVIVSCCFFGCDSTKKEEDYSNTSGIIKVTGVSLNGVPSNNILSIEVGSTITIEAIVSPSNATNKNVSYSSSDSSIATVDNNGEIKGEKDGIAIITATTEDGGYKETCTVSVTTRESTGGGVTLPDVKVN